MPAEDENKETSQTAEVSQPGAAVPGDVVVPAAKADACAATSEGVAVSFDAGAAVPGNAVTADAAVLGDVGAGVAPAVAVDTTPNAATAPAGAAMPSGTAAPATPSDAAAPVLSPVPADAATTEKKPKRANGLRKRSGKKQENRRKKTDVLRVEELQDALAEEGIEGVDPEAVVSMYLPKRRMHRIGAALLRMGALQKALLCLALVLCIVFSVSFIQEKMGNFTINLNRLELFRRGIAIADNAAFEGATARLTAEVVANGTNIAAEDLPSNLDEIDGSHNGRNYVAYTFYIRNAGKEDVQYNATLKIASASKGAEKAARVRLWRNGEMVTYAAPAADGGNEEGCENFESDNTVCTIVDDDFKIGYVDKYTVVIWLDGDDPECVDEIVGGEVEFAMDFDADDANKTSLFAKFVRDIVDTLTGNDPISASGNDAPDYYKNREVTWYDRRNQENPPGEVA